MLESSLSVTWPSHFACCSAISNQLHVGKVFSSLLSCEAFAVVISRKNSYKQSAKPFNLRIPTQTLVNLQNNVRRLTKDSATNRSVDLIMTTSKVPKWKTWNRDFLDFWCVRDGQTNGQTRREECEVKRNGRRIWWALDSKLDQFRVTQTFRSPSNQ